jgi:hypothetical protein
MYAFEAAEHQGYISGIRRDEYHCGQNFAVRNATFRRVRGSRTQGCYGSCYVGYHAGVYLKVCWLERAVQGASLFSRGDTY